MKSYYRLMLGKKSVYAPQCFEGGFIGVDFKIGQDLTGKLPESWRDFNREFIPVYLANHPDKTKVAAGLACGAIWTVSKGIQRGDSVLCPDSGGRYHVGEVIGDYTYQPDGILPHRRAVQWHTQTIARTDMSEALSHSMGFTGTVCRIDQHGEEIETLLGGTAAPLLTAAGETVEDPWCFAMEKHLEDFLVRNWAHTELGKEFEVYADEGERVGQQYLTDTGPLDILAISKDRKTLLVVELKKGRASDVVVGQILRYMGYVNEVLAEPDQQVKGLIIAPDDDQRLRRALSMTPNIDFYRYQVSFKLTKG